MTRRALALLAVTVVLALHVAAAQAADECRGLQVCIPVAGPWVVIPPPAGPLASSSWQLVCPQGIVGGVDARASEAAVAVEFPGRIGSPVNPGITTTQSLLFKGSYAGRQRRATSYQPFIGCIPGGGGGPRTPVSFTRADSVKPGDPITLRVKELPLTPGRLARTTLTCKPRERVLSSGASIGLYTPDAPTAAQLAAVRIVRVRRGRQVLVSATRHGLAGSVRAVLQVRAECAR